MEAITLAMIILLDLALAPSVVLYQHPGVILALLTATAGARYSATAVTPLLPKAAEWTRKFFKSAVASRPLKKRPSGSISAAA